MIAIAPELMRAIHAHARRTYPHECCGALLGALAADGAREVAALHEADNRREASAAARRFLITPDDYRAIERDARARSLEVLGFYHSHPDHPARPSDYDREHAFPWYSYVIVSVRDGVAGETTSWILDDDRTAFAAETIVEALPDSPARAPKRG
ncbi:MAG: M67 family metallopeptidase [Candidatus Krumholzibacteria bacterium]|nr:M67 family metallopeptidase [Candidatus Krumholzibacteria bacterium]MDH4337893.1 M67 family metallopeptidase [Candidatus Krumholzibacteria bacterium]MDH5270222.1 M67 family metallopeptidase [Candidatus Krumholzibacteria bacterium]